jgi:hypothetical protein
VTDRNPTAAARAAVDSTPTEPRTLEVPPERLVQDWRQAHARALAYAEALAIPEEARQRLAAEAVERAVTRADGSSAPTPPAALRALRELVIEQHPVDPGLRRGGPDDFVTWRLARLVAPSDGPSLPLCGGRLWTMPRLTRRPMVPERIERRFFRRLLRRLSTRDLGAERREPLRRQRRHLPWIRAAHQRRALLTLLVLIPSVIASGFMLSVLPHHGQTWLEVAIVVFFGALFGWISIGFWTATFGFFTLVISRRRFAITNLPGLDGPFAPGGRTAVVMPICEGRWSACLPA